MENDNLKLWKEVEETDPAYTKEVSFGRKFTSINAQYQIMQATKQFGKYGEKWGIKSIEYHFIDLDKSQKMALVKAMFFTESSESCFPVSTSIMVQDWDKKKECLRIDDEFAKKAETDITTKALSKLGFSADVFLGRYDDNRYVNSLNEKYKNEAAPKTDNKKESNDNPWLNKYNKDKTERTDYWKIVNAAKEKGLKVADLRKHYKISKELAAELETDLT
jgi:hypothetical protein